MFFMKGLFKLAPDFKTCWNGGFTMSPSLARTRNQQDSDNQQKTLEAARHGRKNGLAVAETCLSFSSSFSAAKRIPILEDGLEGADLQPRLEVHHGIPATACVLACDPVQHLLAVATLDGRIKVFGDAGFEVLLQSSTQAPIRFLQFFNNQGQIVSINTKNDIEVWDLGTRSLSGCLRWEAEVTALAIIQGSPFLYVGDEAGTVKVLQHDLENSELLVTSYCIPIHQTLGEITKDVRAISVVGILPQSNVEHERVLMAYGNGLVVLWGLHQSQVLAVRGGTESQLQVMSGKYKKPKDDEDTPLDPLSKEKKEDDKELCCVCWACPNGSLFAAGYTDGDVWVWSVPYIFRLKGSSENEESQGVKYSCTPALKVQMGSNTIRLPISNLRWWASDEARHGKSGYLCAFGGEFLKIISLKDAHFPKFKSFLELPLLGPITDFLMLQSSTGFPSNPPVALLVLLLQGQLYAYDTAEISNYLKNSIEDRTSLLPEPVLLNLPLVESSVTIAKLILIHRTGKTANSLLQVPRVLKSGFSYHSPAVSEKWFLNGCKETTALVDEKSKGSYIYITGHKNGSVNVWDLSTPYIYSVCRLESQGKEKIESHQVRRDSPVSALDFCSMSGFLAIGNESGLISLYTLSYESQEIDSNRSPSKEEDLRQSAKLISVAVFNAHQLPISCIVIASAYDRLAAGSENGTVSIIDLKTYSLLYHGKSFPSINTRIVSLDFAYGPLSGSAFSFLPSPATPKNKRSALTTVQAVVLFVTTKDGSVISLDGNTGVCHTSGPIKPKHPCTAISMHLLDASGVPAISTAGFQNGVLSETLPLQDSVTKSTSKDVLQMLDSDEFPKIQRCGTSNIKSSRTALAKEESQHLLLVCLEKSLRVYYMSSVLKGARTPSLKIKLHTPCCWTSTFQTPSDKIGLILLYKTGQLEFRSLPDLNLLKVTSLSACLKWQVEPNLSLLRTISCTINGQIALIDCDRELLFFSILDEKHEFRLPAFLPSLYPQDVTKVVDNILVTGSQKNKKKRLLSNVIKEINVIKEMKGGVRKTPAEDDEPMSVLKVAELGRLFRPGSFTSLCSSQVNEGAHSDHSSFLETRSDSLDIDDIDLEDEEYSGKKHSRASNGHSLLRKVKRSLADKKKARKHDTPNDEVQHHDLRRVRTLDEIKSSYGHITQNTSRIAADARDKLLQRQEKLQALDKRTAEMQEEAQDFHTMAKELVKVLEEKNKWKF